MINDYYQQRYPFILHRCRWKYNLAPTVKIPSYTLQPLCEEHIDSLIPLILNPKFFGFYDEVRMNSYRLREVLKRIVIRGGHFVVKSESNKRIIGEIIILEEDKGKWEISYWLDSDLWGSGVMTDIVKGFSAWVFDNTGLVSLYSRCLKTNVSSRRVLEKVGFVPDKDLGEYILLRFDK